MHQDSNAGTDEFQHAVVGGLSRHGQSGVREARPRLPRPALGTLGPGDGGFVTRQDLYKQHAEAARKFEEGNQRRHAPKEKQEKRIKKWDTYYGKVMPFLYSRGFGLWGLLRKLLAQLIGLSRPIVRQVSEGDIRVVVHKSCALAAQTFMLAMSEAGYDTCPLEGFDSLLVKKALGLPRKVEINMVITCGIRQPDGVWGDRYRQPFSETYHRV